MATTQAMNDDSDDGMAENVDENEFIMNHVILPRFLPPKTQDFNDQLKIVNLMLKNALESRPFLPLHTIDLCRKLKSIHLIGEDETLKQNLAKELKSLKVDETFAMFVRHQNCTLIIHKRPHSFILATFHSDVNPREVYSHGSDIENHYPTNAIEVKESQMLKSDHFIEQLCTLHLTEPSENSNQDYVSKWLMTLLADPNSKTASTDDFPIISKKIRSEMVGDKQGYFQRSRIYFSIKVLLQHSLTMELGAERGKFLYKIVMLKFLTSACIPYTVEMRTKFNIALLSQMIAKMARRIDKLQSIQPKTMTAEPLKFLEDTIENAKEVIQTIRQKIDQQIKEIHQNNEKRTVKSLKCLDFKADVCHKNLPALEQYLKDRNSNVSQGADIFESEIKSYRRHFTSQSWPNVDIIDEVNAKTETSNELGNLECRIFWHDFENRVLYTNDLNTKSADLLRQWTLKYMKFSKKMYTDNQLSTSRMILVCLKIIAKLDLQVCTESQYYYLLPKHHTGINPELIDALLLPQRIDMDIAGGIEKYLKDRNTNATDPSLIEEKHVSTKSFAVKFAKKNQAMKQILKQIDDRDEENHAKKKDEWQDRQLHIAVLRAQVDLMPVCLTSYGKKECMPRKCQTCVKNDEIDNVKIDVYERLLPSEEHDRFAIAFELKIPETVSCLRDILFTFVNIFSVKTEKITTSIKEWIQRPDICDFKMSTVKQRVKLGSTVQFTAKKIHVDQPFEKFIAANVSSNCTYHADQYPMPALITNEAIKTSPHFAPFKTDGEYSLLQSTLSGTSHTENEVLARQLKCPENLSLSEYKNFGTLRADGHRLQLRKLYAMIATEKLSFEKESVLSLIMQTIWECGVTATNDGNVDASATVRESHMDFFDQEFCTAMLERLEAYTIQQENNWMHPFKMMMTVLIVVRIFELNNNRPTHNPMIVRMVKFLNKIRSIAYNWIEKIEQVIRDMKTPDEECEAQLRLKLIYVTIIGGLTFFVHSQHKHFSMILENNDINGRTASQQWLHFIITLKNNVQVYTRKEKQLPMNLRMFLRLIERIGIDLEVSIKRLICSKIDQIFELIQMQWPRSDCGGFVSASFHSDFHELLTVDTIARQKVTIDIITGTFLVNGLPLSRLPAYILDSDVYRWCFGNAAFEVQPDSHNSFSTIKRYNDCIYTFKKINEQTTITERNMISGVERELIHHSKFKVDFPNLLVKDYCHWWNKLANRIEFQQKAIDQRHFSKETSIDYMLDLNTKHLIHVKTRRSMLDIKSTSYRKLVENLERLENPRYMHVLLEKENIVVIELFRMKLKFKFNYSETVATNQEFKLVSNEFDGMHVSSVQNIGTLYGLQHGLILESSDPTATAQRKILLIPNGKIRTKYNAASEHHVCVEIETKNSGRNPLFYQYQVDESCEQLKSSDSSHASWFYLAYLHALTSHGQIEPFTGMSGTERAMQILSSSFAWSSSPYEPEALDILREIAKLSPIRKLSDHIQHVTWPRNIPTHSAQDSFVFIVKQLFEDSQRLQGLFTKDPAQDFTTKTELRLNERDYHRCLQLQPNMRVDSVFIKSKVLQTSQLEPDTMSFPLNTQTISILYHTNQCKLPENPKFLARFLTIKRKLLKGLQNDYEKTISKWLYHEESNDLVNDWISLYEIARTRKCSDEELAMVLSLLAHKNKDMDPILALQAIARHRNAFKDINPPQITEYKINEGVYNERKTLTQLRKHFKNKHNTSDHVIDSIESDLGKLIRKAWPCRSIDFSNPPFSSIEFSKRPKITQYDEHYDYAAANVTINKKLATWYERHELDRFIESVQNCLKTLDACTDLELPKYNAYVVPEPKNWPKFNIDVMEKIHKNLCDGQAVKLAKQANDIWTDKHVDLKRSAAEWRSEIERIVHPLECSHLIQAGLFPRTVPSLLLPQIITEDVDERLKVFIIVWGLAIAKEQYMKRVQGGNQASENWRPCQRPEWLLFEIEQNLTIRDIQFKVANQMIDPPKQRESNAKHSVMQLNMGEGKTSVIIPMLAAALANGQQVCQITVLKALFTTNLRSLRQYLGGMLNQRIYTFPCRRDVAIAKHIQMIRHLFEECQMNKGVILTQPDYRLSFQLKLYETLEKGDGEMIKQYLDTYQWINANVRNILDESDAILQPNSQLIYTMGKQSAPDGGEQRWTVIQAVLKRVPYHMKRLLHEWQWSNDRHQKTAPVEYDEKYVANGHVYGAPTVLERNDVFTPCRILDDIFDKLKTALADDFLEARLDIVFSELDAHTKIQLRKLLTEHDVNEVELDAIRMLSSSEKNKIRILSGLLRFEVLKLALTKRWRVNYGVDTTTKGQRKMAIPFKAKDVPANMSEFGHPDVAICLTQLSYYYSGLTDAQLHQLFMTLESRGNAQGIYEGWLASKTAEIPRQLIDPSIESYSAINLDDPNQRDHILFPLLRHNMNAIDYYLSNAVYPSEAKIFEEKLMCTTWDLCSDQLQHCVTGFSGTNDTKTILPMPIAQNDLPELEDTNEKMRQILLNNQNTQNRSYDNLPPNVSGMYIVKKLAAENVPVLLDSGALMLELTNKEVAIEWLKSVPDTFAAAVYFDSNDVLQTIDRNGIVTEFYCSVYQDNLDRCVVYLDDVHTRGIDLKFPSNWVACVTLSGDITRDKTVQSCMRMRRLGIDQKICFWASYEADIRLRKVCNLTNNAQVTNEHVIEFICHNSRQFEISNMSHWTANSLNYTKKMIGHKLFEGAAELDPIEKKWPDLYRMCIDKEMVQLADVYGEKQQRLLCDIAWAKFDCLTSDFKSNKEIRKFIREMQEDVCDKLNKQAPNVKQFSRALNEEQQKELELEQESDEKRQAERLFTIKPAKRSTNLMEKLISIVGYGITDAMIKELKSKKLLYSIPESLSNTQMHQFCEKNPNAWASHLFVSRDFKKVIEGKSKNQDEYLRPVMWILQVKCVARKDVLIIISSYECNELLPIIRGSKYSTLFMYQPKLSQMHPNVLRDQRLYVTGQPITNPIEINDEVQIAMFAGSLYFDTPAEQRAYCGFLGLIPQPWTLEIKEAYEEGEIKSKGFVPKRCRKSMTIIANCVAQCEFFDSPVDFATKLIEARHQSMQKESHVASILERGKLKLHDPERFGSDACIKMEIDDQHYLEESFQRTQ